MKDMEIFLRPNGPALSPDSIFDRIEDPVQRDCGADNFQVAENETGHAEKFIIKN
jgi:hypothetical protein